jgi:two-component system sensor histidine kinase CssS
MKKKTGLIFQISLIFLLAFLVASTLLVFLVSRVLDSFYEDAVFDRLESEGNAVLSSRESVQDIADGDIAFIRYRSRDRSYASSQNLDRFVKEDSAKLIINKAASLQNGVHHLKNSIEGETLWYAVLKKDDLFDIQSGDVLIILTDNRLKEAMGKKTTFNIILFSFAAFAFGYAVILVWSMGLVRDARRISKFVRSSSGPVPDRHMFLKRQDELGEIASGIEEMNLKIKNNEQEKQNLIQGVSHDLRTPLSIIRSHAEALKDDICSPEEAFDAIDRECVRLSGRITKLLHYTRLDHIDPAVSAGRFVDMDSLIREIIPSYKFATEVNIQMELEPVKFRGDRDSWESVVTNMLDNAIRYAKNEIRITLKDNVFSIYNDSSPIPGDKLAHIFDAYEKGSGGSFGLGLAIVKRTAGIFGYSATAKNSDTGIEFTIQ